MSMQSRPNNPIQHRKDQVRAHSRNAVICVGGGIVGGLVLGVLTQHLVTLLILGLVVAVVGGGYNWLKIQRIVNHRDTY